MKFKTFQDPLHWTTTEASTGDAAEIESARTAKSQLERLLSSLLLSENLVVLTGLGTSLCLKDATGKNSIAPTMGDLWKKIAEGTRDFDKLLGEVRQPKEPSGAWIEDIETLLSRCQMAVELNGDANMAAFVKQAEKTIAECCSFLGLLPTGTGLPVHESFLRKIARRPVRLPRTKLFTTNYDLCFETAAGRAGYSLIDGFSHTLPQHFDGTNFTYDLVRREGVADAPAYAPNVLHLLKLHGSVDWNRDDHGIVSRQVAPSNPVIVYPKGGKFKASFEQPYFEMMARFQTAVRTPNTGLLVVGFGFNDSHLVGPIQSALRANASLRMIAVAPSYETKQPELVKEIDKLIEAGDRRLTLIAGDFEALTKSVPDLTSVSEEELHQARTRNLGGK
jgi:hypothetical protein